MSCFLLDLFLFGVQVVAVDRVGGNRLLAFQQLSTRERGSRDGGAVKLEGIKARYFHTCENM